MQSYKLINSSCIDRQTIAQPKTTIQIRIKHEPSPIIQPQNKSQNVYQKKKIKPK